VDEGTRERMGNVLREAPVMMFSMCPVYVLSPFPVLSTCFLRRYSSRSIVDAFVCSLLSSLVRSFMPFPLYSYYFPTGYPHTFPLTFPYAFSCASSLERVLSCAFSVARSLVRVLLNAFSCAFSLPILSPFNVLHAFTCTFIFSPLQSKIYCA